MRGNNSMKIYYLDSHENNLFSFPEKEHICSMNGFRFWGKLKLFLRANLLFLCFTLPEKNFLGDNEILNKVVTVITLMLTEYMILLFVAVITSKKRGKTGDGTKPLKK